MEINLKIKNLREKLHLTQEEFASKIGVNKKTIVFWENGKSKISKSKLLTICNICNLPSNFFENNVTNENVKNEANNDIIKIPYFDWLPDELKNPKYPDVVARLHSIDGWGNADNLRIMAMNGDKMEHFWYRIRNKDVLLIDTNETKINNNGSGVYFATSRNNTKFWVREMTETIDDGIEFKAYAPSGVTVKLLSKQQLIDADFRIIGRVIKNVSLTI